MKAMFLCVILLSWSTMVLATHPRNLAPISNGDRYILSEDFQSSEKAATFTLKAGTYVAAFEDREALYLVGDPDCLEMHVRPPKQPEHAYTTSFNCGIYYPKAEAGQARFFYIRGALPRNDFGLIVNAIIKSGEGGFQYPISKKFVIGLRPKLQVTQP